MSSAEALVDGEWVPHGAIRHWRLLEVVPDLPKSYDLRTLIACPTCHAKVTECCRTRNGAKTHEHTNRLAPRLCPCGELPGRRRTVCEACARENDRRAKRAYKARLRREMKDA